MAKEIPSAFALSLADPLKDYQELMDNKLNCDDELYGEVWNKIADSTCSTVWKLLFDTKSPPKDQTDKAAALLKQFKEDACFQDPTAYNKWIYKFRDELLKQQHTDFWKNVVVAKELGPCWARDSDMFDNMEDPEPVNFYKYAGCEAAWLKNDAHKPTAPPLNLMCNTDATAASPGSPKSLKKLSEDTALEDYKHNMSAQKDIDPDDEEAYKQIFREARDIIWKLLFTEATPSAAKSKIAANLLQEVKLDACFYSPYDYNDWIPKVRDELLKRKYFDFWQIIVNEKLGLCCSSDSDYFDDEEDDSEALQFYKYGDEIMKQQKK